MAKRTTPSSSTDSAGDLTTGAPKKPRAPRAPKRATQPTPAATASDQASAVIAASNGAGANGASGEHPAIDEPIAAGPADVDVTASSEPTEDEIRYHAYLRFLERGGGHGYHLEDWVHAERELRTKR